MNVSSVNLQMINMQSMKNLSAFSKTNLTTSEAMQSQGNIPVQPRLSTVSMLAQMPNVSFRGTYGSDDLSAYDNYVGPIPPEIEIEKYRLSVRVKSDIENGDYLSAIKGKLNLARICRQQGNERDAYMLEESIRKLYGELPTHVRPEAKDAIRPYNHDMAKYIDQDIERYR